MSTSIDDLLKGGSGTDMSEVDSILEELNNSAKNQPPPTQQQIAPPIQQQQQADPQIIAQLNVQQQQLEQLSMA